MRLIFISRKMQKTNTENTDYRILFLSKFKGNLISSTLGLIVFLLLSSFGLAYTLPKLTPLFSKKTTNESKGLADAKIQPTKKIRTYTVQAGDTLFLIAERIYGSGLNMQDIMKTNKMNNPDQIEVGQKLIIPDVEPRYPTSGSITNTSAQTSQVTERSEKYVVKEGDDLAKIALQTYGDSYSWTKIAEANNLTNPDDIRVGMILIIPR